MADPQDKQEQDRKFREELNKMPAIDRVKAKGLEVNFEVDKQTGSIPDGTDKTQWIKDRLHGYKELD
jgi:hypothetical protein